MRVRKEVRRTKISTTGVLLELRFAHQSLARNTLKIVVIGSALLTKGG